MRPYDFGYKRSQEWALVSDLISERLLSIYVSRATSAALQLLNRFYAERLISVTSRDSNYITPAIKSKLRRKNRLSRAGRIKEANALARRIGKDIAARKRTRLSRINHKKCARDMWAAVRQLTGRRHKDEVCDGITAETLHQHYAQISTDTSYQRPPRKLTATHRDE